MSKMSDIEGGFFIMKIGLPRGLLYHSYGPFMEAFLSELPAEIIISEETDRDILDRGTAACIDDACLPVKVYAGQMCIRDSVTSGRCRIPTDQTSRRSAGSSMTKRKL